MGAKKERTAEIAARKTTANEKKHFLNFFQTSADVMVIADPNGAFMKTNPACSEILGYSEAELVSKPFIEFVHPEDKQSTLDEMAQQRQKGFSLNFENRYLCKNGSVKWLSWRATYVKEEGITYATARDITERKQMEEQLQKSAAELSEAQRVARVGSWNWDAAKDSIWWSDEYYHLYNIDPNFPTPNYREHLQAYTTESGAQLDAAVKKSMATGEPYKLDLQLAHPSAEIQWIAARGEVKRDPNGRIIGLRGTAQDITERKNAEVERDRILTMSQDLICIAGTDGFMKYVNPASEAILGYTQHELIAKPFYEFIYPDDRRKTEEEVAKLAAGRITVDFDNRYMHKDGSIRAINWRATPLPEKGLMYCVGRDITRRRKAEQFVRDILESVSEEFIVIDPGYRIVSANKAYCLYADKPAEDLVGRHCYEVTHHSSNPCHERGETCPVKLTFETGEPQAALHTHTDSDGNQQNVEIKAYPMKDAEGRTISVIETITDITEKRKLEDQLRQAQKMEAIGQIAGGVAHDFNNILTAILGYGNLVHMKMDHDDPQRIHMEQILAAAERAATLTHSLLAFSRKQAMSLKPVSLNYIVNQVERFLKRLIGEDVELKTIIAEDELFAEADSGQIEQVLMNLATNARDAMPHGGCLTMGLETFEIDREFISAHGFGEPGKYAVMTMTDTGGGMDEKTRLKIFEPFFTTKDPGKGTGLGLAIVYGIVKQHKGYINVYSELGKGTCFRIYIPLIRTKTEGAIQAVIPPPQMGTELVLIAEDDAPVRELTRIVLETYGYKVIAAIDGEDAIAKFNENKSAIQLVILDLIMPKKSGKEVYQEIRKSTPDMKVLFVSGYTADRMQAEGIVEQGLENLQKPVAPRDLLNKVREVLDKPKSPR